MSKKEIRRAARDAYPKAKNATTAKKRGTGGAYSKRQHAVGPRTATGRPAPGPPNIRRALVMGLVGGLLYFALIQWVFHFENATTTNNVVVGVIGAVLFTLANYFSSLFRYKRYLKSKGSSK